MWEGGGKGGKGEERGEGKGEERGMGPKPGPKVVSFHDHLFQRGLYAYTRPNCIEMKHLWRQKPTLWPGDRPGGTMLTEGNSGAAEF